MKSCSLTNSTVMVFLYIFIWVFLLQWWYKISHNTVLTFSQMIFTAFYFVLFVWIIEDSCVLWTFLGVFVFFVLLKYLLFRNGNFSEGFETKSGSSNNDNKTKPIIPLTNASATSEVDEWSEEDNKKAQGVVTTVEKKGNNVISEAQAAEERTGITFTPAAAQRETYKLIDAVQQLQEVMTSLSPTLREGKKIIDMFDKMQLNK
jgi:hypothetical protein